MFQNLKLINFQNHLSTHIDFVKGVNVIVGKSDSGKSAIIRALNWIVSNKPKGDSFRSFWGGTTRASLKFDGGIKIIRRKGEIENSYVLGTKKYVALRGSIPDDVGEAINLSDVNFQFQFDPSFLFSSSSGEVARYFNKIIHLDNIDSSLQNITRAYTQENNQVENKKQELRDLRESLLGYRWIKDADARLSLVESENAALKKKQEELEKLNRIIIDIEKKAESKKEILKRLRFSDRIQKIINEFSCIEEKKNKIKGTQEIAVEIENLLEKQKSMEKEILLLENKLNELFPKRCPLCNQSIKGSYVNK